MSEKEPVTNVVVNIDGKAIMETVYDKLSDIIQVLYMTTWWQRTTKTYSGETTLDQGSDGSSEYLNNKRIRFVIGQYNTGASVSFKPFLTRS